jgi:hypothetical protein
MHKSRSTAISIFSGQHKATLSKGQKAFNVLIKKIETSQDRLVAWQEVNPIYQKKYVAEFVPLQERFQQLQVDFVYCLDFIIEKKGLNASERRKVSDLIRYLSGNLAFERDDEDLKRLYTKYSGFDFDAEVSISKQNITLQFEEMMGIDLGDNLDDLSPDEFMRRAAAHLKEARDQFEAEQQTRKERRALRNKTAKQLEREAQQKVEAQEAIQSIREIYRKLASVLHPDREADPLERERKTDLMQKVNQAYDKKNLVLLLKLQVELEHIDQATMDNLTESRLKSFTKILKEQLAELEQEVFDAQERFKSQFGINPSTRVYPETVLQHLDGNIGEFLLNIHGLEKDIGVLQNSQNVKGIKAWIKRLDGF